MLHPDLFRFLGPNFTGHVFKGLGGGRPVLRGTKAGQAEGCILGPAKGKLGVELCVQDSHYTEQAKGGSGLG